MLCHDTPQPRVRVEISISGPAGVGKEDPSRGLADTLKEHGFNVIVRHEAPGPVNNNIVYALRTQRFITVPDSRKW